MTNVKTHTRRRAGQARRAGTRPDIRIHIPTRTIVLYGGLTVAGILLFRIGSAYALHERGYRAIGGEMFALFLPFFYYAISGTVKDFVRDIKTGFKPEYMEDDEE